ncbi:MAG: T9SS type A sorting domain-containing protein [Saprospiraceae bacterium]|nr:T9SS type A sorting domain-containing protein [Saprospiraceae bacterium]
MIRIVLSLLTCFFFTGSLMAQSLFLVDNLYLKFQEHDMQTGMVTDHRDLSGGLPYDVYDCISYHPVDKVFYVAYDKYLATDRIMRYNPSSKIYTPVITTGLEKVVDMDFDLGAGKIYFLDKDTKLIQRANLDGSNIEQVGPGQSFLTGWTPVLAVDETHGLLFYTIGGGQINFTDLDTWSPAEMPSSVYVAGGRVGDIAIDETNTWIYWTYNLSQEPSSVNRTNLETFVTETLHSNMEPHNYLSLYNGRVYWSTTGSVIHSTTLTGTDLKMEYDVPSGTFAADFVVMAGSTTSIDPTYVAEKLELFPNPAVSTTTLSFGESVMSDIQILDASGKIVQTRKGPFTGQMELSLSDLMPGQYIVQARRTSGGWVTASFAKL